MKAIILTPPDPELGNAACVAWVRSERDILADDIAAAGGRLIAAIALVGSGELSGFRALMLTETVDTSTDIVGACNAVSGLLAPLIDEAGVFAYARGAASLSFELTFGSEVLGRSDDKDIVILPAMTEPEAGRRDVDR